MKQKWICKSVQGVPFEIEQDEYERRIAEIWEILYGEFRQLHKISRPIESELIVSRENALTERTGTDG